MYYMYTHSTVECRYAQVYASDTVTKRNHRYLGVFSSNWISVYEGLGGVGRIENNKAILQEMYDGGFGWG